MSLKSQSFKIKTLGYTGTKIIEKLYFYSFSPFAFRLYPIAYRLSALKWQIVVIVRCIHRRSSGR